ncbi:MAG: DUF1565 domain-containing protein [Planctomycetota bacterium]|nr:DUF1565 domain-containing protein [Planctomycetota bacterium]
MRPSLRHHLALVRLALLLTLALATAACGGGSVVIGGAPDYYVDVAIGSDANDGSAAAPFKTITRGLEAAALGSTVYVAPGMYDAVIGESFPLEIPTGVRLIGDQPNKGNGPIPTVIFGGALVPGEVEANTTAAVLPGMDVAIGGFVIHNPLTLQGIRHTGVIVDRMSVRVRHCTIEHNMDDGIRFLGGSGFGHVHHNLVRHNTAGFHFAGGGGLIRFDNNALKLNDFGAVVKADFVDLGGGGAGSEGNNMIAFNSDADLVVHPNIHVDAQDNQWNHIPPTSHTEGESAQMPSGVDHWLLSDSAYVEANGAGLALLITWVPPYVPIDP